MKNRLYKRLLALSLALFLILPAKVSAAEINNPLSEESKSEESYYEEIPDAEPAYVRSYWWQGYYPLDKGDVAFYRDSNGYRGYVSRQGDVTAVILGVTMGVYGGTLYHPSVKNIPAFSIDEDPSILSIENTSVATKTKYVQVTRTYPYDSVKYGSSYTGIPMSVFYNDGFYKGYIHHNSYLPIDIGRNKITVTYGGNVYSGGNHPALGIDNPVEVE